MTVPIAFLPLMLVGLLLVGPRLATAQGLTPPPQVQAGYYRLRLGNFLITALSDGSAPVPVVPLLINVPPARVRQLLASQYLSDSVATSINTYLIDTGTKRLLVDTGAGSFYGPAGGHLLTSLRAAGYQPEQIDAVLLTHLHSDHSGGLVQGGQLTFPNATVYAAQPEVDFWLTPANQAKVAAANRHQFKEAETTVRPVLTAGKLKTFRGDAELFPGVRPLARPGHTPGHSGLRGREPRPKAGAVGRFTARGRGAICRPHHRRYHR